MLLRIIVGIFIVLHGLVHWLYFGQSRRLFELQPGMVWPDGSWVLTRLLGTGGTRSLAGILCILAAVGFVAGGIGIFAGQPWWRPVVVGSAVFSSLIYILLWDGMLHGLDNQGGIALIINLAILISTLIFRWPAFAF